MSKPDNSSGQSSDVIAMIEKLGYEKTEATVYERGQMIETEGSLNLNLYLILEGEVEMLKRGDLDSSTRVDVFGPGDLLGLTSFWSKEPSFLESRAISTVRCICLDAEKIETFVHSSPEVRETLHRLFISTLSRRYRRIASLNLKVSELSIALEREKNDLQAALKDLTETRNQLIHSERLATLGQLLAGIAHEMNNPVASLQSAFGHIEAEFPELIQSLDPASAKLLKAGLSSAFVDSDSRRQQLEDILHKHPKLKRSLARRLASLPLEHFELLCQFVGKDMDDTALVKALSYYETGSDLRNVGLSSKRIASLIQSLKNYARPDSHSWETIDPIAGIQDTLILLNNRLRHYKLHLDLPSVAHIRAIPQELNQVWTNLLVNACDATAPGGDLWISAEQIDHTVIITFADSGTGIDPELMEKIYELNFTTKKTKAQFGLGLGLSISKDIVEKHRGQIVTRNREPNGAVFEVRLPIQN